MSTAGQTSEQITRQALDKAFELGRRSVLERRVIGADWEEELAVLASQLVNALTVRPAAGGLG